jgi:Glycosyl transferase family 2
LSVPNLCTPVFDLSHVRVSRGWITPAIALIWPLTFVARRPVGLGRRATSPVIFCRVPSWGTGHAVDERPDRPRIQSGGKIPANPGPAAVSAPVSSDDTGLAPGPSTEIRLLSPRSDDGRTAAAVAPPGGTAPVLSVLVPTRGEAPNVVPLLRRLASALDGMTYEVIFADDSDDETPAAIAAAASTSPVPVRLLHRGRGDRTGGLGGAVCAAIRHCAAPYAVVMDGDLQHPPEAVPLLLSAARERALDVVIGSRYIEGGSARGLAGATRHLVSAGSNTLARLVFPGRLRGVSDAMSGFFLIRVTAFDLDRLRPDGYKILLELLASRRRLRVAEVGYEFGSRQAGRSNASFAQGLRFARRLLALRFPRPAGAGMPGGDGVPGRDGMPGRDGFVSVGRLCLPPVLAVAAFPNLVRSAPDLLQHRWGVGTLLVIGSAAALAVGGIRPRAGEPEVHDRQLDLILAAPALAAAGWLALSWAPAGGRDDEWSNRGVAGAVAFLLGTCLVVWGTRATARQKWALLALPAAAPAIASVLVVPIMVGLFAAATAAGSLARVGRRGRADAATAARWEFGGPRLTWELALVGLLTVALCLRAVALG